MKPPVNVGDITTVEIISKGKKNGEDGDGVCKIKGYVIFVADTNVGETVEIKITKTFSNYGFAEVLQVLPNEQ